MHGLKRRLLLPVFAMSVLVVIALSVAAWDAWSQGALLRERVGDVQRASELIVRLNALRGETQVQVLRFIARPDEARTAALAQMDAESDAAVAELGGQQSSPVAQRLYTQMVNAQGLVKSTRSQLLAAARLDDPGAVALASLRWDLTRRRSDAIFADVSGFNLNRLQRTLVDLDERRSTLLALGLALAVSLATVLFFALAVARLVVRPLVTLTEAARGLPDAPFEPPAQIARREDEIGHLARALSRVTAEMRLSNARLREADHRKDEFLAVLSHELRNPLAPIRNALSILERSDPSATHAGNARAVIGRQVVHMTRLVDDLLDVTRIARGKIELQTAPIDLTALLARAADDHRNLLQARGQQFEAAFPNQPVVVIGDETRLAQVVGNLVQNAAKFTPSGGRVRLALRTDADHAWIDVVDTGLGIDPAVQDEIFEPFSQGKQSLARTEGGLGLGLALVKGIVDMHGGAVSVHSDGAGQGSRFTVRLPLTAMAAPMADPEPTALDGHAVSGRRVLVVDDNQDAAQTLAELVELLGHTVLTAFDGPQALRRADAFDPDIVLCDIGLPGMSGFEVATALRERLGTRVRLYALSGYARSEDVAKARKAGFDDHLSKPADPQHIARLLGEA